MKKALIFDPYLDTLGGGERYVLTFALSLLNSDYQVEIAWRGRSELNAAESRFGLDLSRLTVNSDAYHWCANKSSLVSRWQNSRQYDVIFWVSDGSLPFLFGKTNLVHFQVPFTKIGGGPVLTQLKQLFIDRFVYNSKFTQTVLERHLDPSKSFVLYPPINTQEFVAGHKDDLILSVARFDKSLVNKHHDVLISAFKSLIKSHPSYHLVLAGGLKGDMSLLTDLKKQAQGLPVEFLVGPNFSTLKDLYSRAKFFWHAAGYGIDEKNYPENVEHFGMTTVEAMSSGAVPIVIGKGGQKEIVTETTGYLCDTPEEMAERTSSLIKNIAKYLSMSKEAVKRSSDFSTDVFNKKVSNLL